MLRDVNQYLTPEKIMYIYIISGLVLTTLVALRLIFTIDWPLNSKIWNWPKTNSKDAEWCSVVIIIVNCSEFHIDNFIIIIIICLLFSSYTKLSSYMWKAKQTQIVFGVGCSEDKVKYHKGLNLYIQRRKSYKICEHLYLCDVTSQCLSRYYTRIFFL